MSEMKNHQPNTMCALLFVEDSHLSGVMADGDQEPKGHHVYMIQRQDNCYKRIDRIWTMPVKSTIELIKLQRESRIE